MSEAMREAFEAHFKGQIRFQDFDIRYGRYVAKEPYVFGTDRQADEANTLFEGYKAALSGAQQGEAIGWRKAKDGEHWPHIGGKYLIKLNGVLQHEVYEFDQGDDGMGGGEYFWDRDDLDEGAPFNPEKDEWLPIDEAGMPAAPQPAQVPEGWRLVPVEPTTEMLGEGAIALFAQSREPLSSAYRNMLAAAPRCPMLTAAPSGDASLAETARAFDAAPDDAEFGPDHPVFKLAAERDALLFRVRELESGDAKREAEIEEVLDALGEKLRIEADMEDFDGDRRGMAGCLREAERELEQAYARLRQSSDGDDSEGENPWVS